MAVSSLFGAVDGGAVLEQVCKPRWRNEEEQRDFVKGQGELLAGTEAALLWTGLAGGLQEDL